MGSPLLEVITYWSGVPGTPWRTRMLFPWDGDEQAGVAACSMVGAFWDRLVDWIGQGQVWSVPLVIPVLDDATGAWVDSVPGTGASGSPGNFVNTNAAQVQVCARLSTLARPGPRALQGRLYVPGVTSTVYDTDRPFVSEDRRRELAGWIASDLLTGPPSHPTTQLSIWSRTYGLSAPVEATSVDPYLTTLRSRAAR